MAGRLLVLLLGTGVLALLGPFVPSFRPGSHLPATGGEYVALVGPSLVVALLVGVAAGYEYIAKPVKNYRLGYQLMERFVVQGKQQLFGSNWLELPPDDTHRVGVPQAVFKAIQTGDTVEVVYSATADFIGVYKINPLAARA